VEDGERVWYRNAFYEKLTAGSEDVRCQFNLEHLVALPTQQRKQIFAGANGLYKLKDSERHIKEAVKDCFAPSNHDNWGYGENGEYVFGYATDSWGRWHYTFEIKVPGVNNAVLIAHAAQPYTFASSHKGDCKPFYIPNFKDNSILKRDSLRKFRQIDTAHNGSALYPINFECLENNMFDPQWAPENPHLLELVYLPNPALQSLAENVEKESWSTQSRDGVEILQNFLR